MLAIVGQVVFHRGDNMKNRMSFISFLKRLMLDDRGFLEAFLPIVAGGLVTNLLGGMFGGGGSSGGSATQTTRVQPAERTAEGKAIWEDFMRQLYGSRFGQSQQQGTSSPIIQQLINRRPWG